MTFYIKDKYFRTWKVVEIEYNDKNSYENIRTIIVIERGKDKKTFYWDGIISFEKVVKKLIKILGSDKE